MGGGWWCGGRDGEGSEMGAGMALFNDFTEIRESHFHQNLVALKFLCSALKTKLFDLFLITDP